MFNFGVNYDEPLFRPPSEAYSVIIQATLGCSWNKCAFCEMYKTKKYSERSLVDIESDIKALAGVHSDSRKFFIADGDALEMPTDKIVDIIKLIKANFPRVQRVSSYASVRNIAKKTESELAVLKSEGLTLLYVGLESGDDELLQMVNKGETFDESVVQLKKIHDIGIDTSVMILNGLGGTKYYQQHAVNSSKIINEIQPKFLSLLSLYHPRGIDVYKKRFKGEFIEQNQIQLLEEIRLFIENLELKHTIYRSDHASNYLVLKGTLGKNKQEFLNKIDEVINYLINNT